MNKCQVWLGAGTLLVAACTTVNNGGDLSAHRAGADNPGLVATAAATAAVPVQDGVGQRDYSPSGLFAERHGGFLTRAKRYEPKLFVRYMVMADAQVTSEPGSFDLQELRARGDIPITLDPDSYMSLGAEFRQRDYDFSNNVLGARDEDVYVLGARIGAGLFINDEFLVEAMFRPGIYSDLDGTMTSQDWHWFGHALGTYRIREDLFLKAGAAVSEDFADVDVIPLAGLAWTIDEQWRVDLLLPHRAEISWSPNAGTSTIRAGVYLEGDNYRVRGPASLGKPRVEWQTQEITISAGLVQRLSDYLSVFGEVGSAVAGDYKVRDGSSQTYTGSLDPTFYFNVGVGFDF
jgi:hypothetical protein